MQLFREVDRSRSAASSNVRRALANMNVESPAVRSLVVALKALKMKTEAPTWRGEATAHVGVPLAKVAFMVVGNGGSSGVQVSLEPREAAWKKQGWKFLVVSARLLRLAEARGELAGTLKEALL